MASLYKDLKQHDQSIESYRRAASLYRENGTGDQAAAVLEKAGMMLVFIVVLTLTCWHKFNRVSRMLS